MAALAIRPCASGVQQLHLPFPPQLVSVIYAIELPPRIPLRKPSMASTGQVDLVWYCSRPRRLEAIIQKVLSSKSSMSSEEDREVRYMLDELSDHRRRRLIEAVLQRLDRLLISEARRIVGQGSGIEDLSQEARIIAFQALDSDRRNPDKPLMPYIVGALRRGLPRAHNKSHRLIRVPERQMRRVCELWRSGVTSELAGQMSTEDIAAKLGVSMEKAKNVRIALNALELVDDEHPVSFSPITPESTLIDAEARICHQHNFQANLEALPRLHRTLLLARFPPGERPCRLSVAASLVGISTSRARQMMRETKWLLQKMQEKVET